MSALRGAGRRGQEAEDEFYDRARSFDPHESVRTSAMGAWESMMPDVRREIEDTRGRMAGAGRLRGGYGEMDEDDVWDRATHRLTSGIQRDATQAAGMEMQHIHALGGYGERTTGRYLDLITGERDREAMEREAERQRKSSRWGALAGLAGSALGTVLGPAGTAIGGKIGSWVGDKIGAS